MSTRRWYGLPQGWARFLATSSIVVLASCTGEGDGGVPPTPVPVPVPAPFPITVGYLKASNTEAGDEFGRSIALSADSTTLTVGAPEEDSCSLGVNGIETDNSCSAAGAVYVFTQMGGIWTQQAYVKASNPGGGDRFGHGIALSADGNTLAVGAPFEDSNAIGINGDQNNNNTPDSGGVYVFTRTAGVWSQQAYVKASNTGTEAFFGYRVALDGDGNTLVVGAPAEDSCATGINGNQADNACDHAGAVFVFTRTAGVWSQQAYVKASNTETADVFGISIAVSSDTIAVGATDEDSCATGINGNQADNNCGGAGALYVFTRTAGIWSQQSYLKTSNTGNGDQFGYSVSLSSETLAAGALSEDSCATGLNGNQADNSCNQSGAVYVFTRSAGVWNQQAYLKASNTGSDDQFGFSTTVSGDALAVGANQEGSCATGLNGNQADNSCQPAAGAVYVFSRTAGVWSQQVYVKASNTQADDIFGSSIALTNDTLVVAAPQEDSCASGFNGNQADNACGSAGAVY